METQKNLRLIAKFMRNPKMDEYDSKNQIILSYNNSDKWVMPVIDRIETLIANSTLNDFLESILEEIIAAKNNINKLYLISVDYINWYNKEYNIRF